MSRYSRLQCQRCGVDIHDGDSRFCDICWAEEEEAWSGYDKYLDWLDQMDEADMDDEL